MPSHILFHTMGIPVHVTLAGNNSSSQQHAVRETLYAVFDAWDKRFSRFRLDSELHYINEHSGSSIPVSLEMFSVLVRCRELSLETNGVFDASVGAYLAAAGYGLPNHYILPKKVPTYKDMVLDETTHTVTCARGQVLEPAGIVKGMAIDAAGQTLMESKSGWMINAGGDILTHGPFNIDNNEWRVGIQHPQIPNAIVTVVGVRNEAIATSGTYAVVFRSNAFLSHHQVAMHEGVSTKDSISVTVIAPSAQKADEYASIGILLGKDKGTAYLDRHRVPYLFIGMDGVVTKNGLFMERERPLT